MNPRIEEKKPKIDISQAKIRTKFHSYLVKQNRPAEVTTLFVKGKGYCHGFATLAIYTQYIESLKQNRPHAPRDDWKWLKKILRRLAIWNEDLNSLTEHEKQEVDRVIGYIAFFQNIKKYLHPAQGDLHNYLEDTANRKIKLEYTFAGLFTLNDFLKPLKIKKTLGTPTLLDILTQHDKRLILISCGNHTLSLFTSENRVSFYNANRASGRKWCDNKTSLIQTIFKAYKYNEQEPSPLGFRIFTFDETLGKYPKKTAILDKFHNPLTVDTQTRSVDYSALHIAARIGSKKCVDYYLAKGAGINDVLIQKHTALHIAVSRNHPSIAASLIAKNADINKRIENGDSPLMLACRLGRFKIIKLMLEHSHNANFNNLLTILNTIPARFKPEELVLSLNKKTLPQMMEKKTLAENQLNQYKLSRHYKEGVYNYLQTLIQEHKKAGIPHNKLTLFPPKKGEQISEITCILPTTLKYEIF